jgi:hypothetical protein
MLDLKRREFINLLGGVAAAWPFAARAQEQDRQRLVGVVAGFSEAEMRPLLTAFRSKLNQLGWTEGRNLAIDARLGAGDYQRMTAEAGTLISRNPDVVVTMGTPGLTAIDPELMIRMLIVGYCYGVRFERQLCQEVDCISPTASFAGIRARICRSRGYRYLF